SRVVLSSYSCAIGSIPASYYPLHCCACVVPDAHHWPYFTPKTRQTVRWLFSHTHPLALLVDACEKPQVIRYSGGGRSSLGLQLNESKEDSVCRFPRMLIGMLGPMSK